MYTMKPIEFLKTLNYKINKYDKTLSNPFKYDKREITVIWVENPDKSIDSSAETSE